MKEKKQYKLIQTPIRYKINPNLLNNMERMIFMKYNDLTSLQMRGISLDSIVTDTARQYRSLRLKKKNVSHFMIWCERINVRWRRANTTYAMKYGVGRQKVSKYIAHHQRKEILDES